MIKRKKCRACPNKFTPVNTLQIACSPSCALKIAKKKTAEKEKAQRKRTREQKEALKSLSDLLKEAQKEFNAFIRERDKDLPCISCGRHHQGQYHAGHYRTVGAHPELRFEELNCHKQCSVCNNHKSGNIVEYRINLKNKISEEQLDWLEGYHEPKRYTKDDARAIKQLYRNKTKVLKGQLCGTCWEKHGKIECRGTHE